MFLLKDEPGELAAVMRPNGMGKVPSLVLWLVCYGQLRVMLKSTVIDCGGGAEQ